MAALNDGLQHTDSGNYRKTINIPTLSIPLHKLSIVLWTWDLGCTAYGERVDWNKRLLKSPRLALRLSLPYIYIYPHFPWFPTSRSCSPHQGVWVYSNAECMGNDDGMHCPCLTASQWLISECLGFRSIY